MEYISAEEFLKQPKEVQEVFKDWWKPQSSDLFQYKHLFNVVDCLCGEAISPFNEDYVVFKKECIPLLTEGQLRKFIEDKTKYKLEISYYEINGYDISLTDGKTNYFNYLDLGRDLLQAYWKVACEIAKEELRND